MALSVAFSSLAAFALNLIPASAEAVRYSVGEPSDFQDGCQDGCACPISVFPLQGAFVLTPVGQQDGFDVFDVTDVEWVIVSDPTGERLVTGSGQFRISQEPEPLQRLGLDLSIEGRSPVHFDSGFVHATVTWPDVEIAIAMNDFFCYDNVFSLHAQPEGPITMVPDTWGRIKGSYRP